MSKPVTEQQIVEIITATFKHRERKIWEMAARHARDSLECDLRDRGMLVRIPRLRRIKADFSLANALVRPAA